MCCTVWLVGMSPSECGLELRVHQTTPTQTNLLQRLMSRTHLVPTENSIHPSLSLVSFIVSMEIVYWFSDITLFCIIMYFLRLRSSTCCLTFHREQCSGALWGDTTECHGVTRQVFSWKLQEPDHPIEVPMTISQHALPRPLPACNTNVLISFWTISFSMNCVSDIFWALKFHMFSLLFIDIGYIYLKRIVYLIYTIQDNICTLSSNNALWHTYT